MIQDYYLITKAIHIISIICWMAGLLYLPRLFVYHISAKKDSDLDKTLKIMERKLYVYIMHISALFTLFSGIFLRFMIENIQKWPYIKIFLLFLLYFFHFFLGICQKNFENNKNIHSEKFYRMINEVPTIIMIIIVFLSILKPF